SSKTIITVAGNGQPGYSGDGGIAVNAELDDPTGVALDGQGNLFIADRYNDRIREVNAISADIETVAGDGGTGPAGDGELGTKASLGFPYAVSVDSADNIYIADTDDQRVRVVSASDRVMSTLAGDGIIGISQSNARAGKGELSGPTGIALGNAGDLFVTDGGNNRLIEIKLSGAGQPVASRTSEPSGNFRAQIPNAKRSPSPVSSVLMPVSGSGAPAEEPNLAPGIGEPLSSDPTVPQGDTSLLILGDSLAYTLGEGLVLLGNQYSTDVINGSTIGCGISQGGPLKTSGITSPQPAMCDSWASTWAQHVTAWSPSAVAILVGRWELVDRIQNGHWTHIGQRSYDNLLLERLRSAIQIASGNSESTTADVGPIPVVLMTMPYLLPYAKPTGSGVYPETDPMRVDMFNRMQYEAASGFPGHAYVFDLSGLLDPGGHFALEESNRTIRWPDGTHITTGGSSVVAPILLHSLGNLMSP
ncbi:MAG TPA: SGNH hydrolase domain-containing protein, partial [Acidimicrobiales bacterium]|nr:SGNH hydrolase domain-containing protein [Acidimicrobiales bacterium]